MKPVLQALRHEVENPRPGGLDANPPEIDILSLLEGPAERRWQGDGLGLLGGVVVRLLRRHPFADDDELADGARPVGGDDADVADPGDSAGVAADPQPGRRRTNVILLPILRLLRFRRHDLGENSLPRHDHGGGPGEVVARRKLVVGGGSDHGRRGTEAHEHRIAVARLAEGRPGGDSQPEEEHPAATGHDHLTNRKCLELIKAQSRSWSPSAGDGETATISAASAASRGDGGRERVAR